MWRYSAARARFVRLVAALGAGIAGITRFHAACSRKMPWSASISPPSIGVVSRSASAAPFTTQLCWSMRHATAGRPARPSHSRVGASPRQSASFQPKATSHAPRSPASSSFARCVATRCSNSSRDRQPERSHCASVAAPRVTCRWASMNAGPSQRPPRSIDRSASDAGASIASITPSRTEMEVACGRAGSAVQILAFVMVKSRMFRWISRGEGRQAGLCYGPYDVDALLDLARARLSCDDCRRMHRSTCTEAACAHRGARKRRARDHQLAHGFDARSCRREQRRSVGMEGLFKRRRSAVA